MNSPCQDIVDVQRYPISIKLPNSGSLRWELKFYTTEEEDFVHYVKLSKRREELEAQLGRELRGEEAVADEVSLYALDSEGNKVKVELHNGKATGLEEYVVRGRLKLELTVDDDFKWSNEYLSRRLIIPTDNEGSLPEDMLNLLHSNEGSDAYLPSDVGPDIKFHSVIFSSRLPRIKSMWPKLLVDNRIKTEVEKEIWDLLLHYVYTDQLPECSNVEVILSLLEIAISVVRIRFVALASQQLIRKFSSENIVYIYSRISPFSEYYPFVVIIKDFMDVRFNRMSTIETIVKNPLCDDNMKAFIRDFGISQQVKDGIKRTIRLSLDSDVIDTDYITNAKSLISSLT